MAIIRWNPWNLSSLLEDDLDLPTIPGLSRLGQGLNIYETEDEIVVEAAMPGISEDQVDVSYENGMVRISASSQTQEEEKGKRRYYMSSMPASYNYSFRLPDGMVENAEPKAELDNGILTLTFDKMKKIPPKKVKVVKKVKVKTQ